MKKSLKRIFFFLSGIIFVFFFYVTCLHLAVYGFKYVALLSNLHIMVTRPECTYTFLTPDSLKNKFSYKLFMWLGNNNELDPAVKVEKIPDTLVAKYFTPDKSIDYTLNKVKCDFSKPTTSWRKSKRYMHFSYSYQYDMIGVRSATISLNDRDGKASDISGYLYWGF
ncbi:hypothetical protein [Citrobacter amalonaticus]|nr:hypothetical protein [Citrobacter amalonaticus]